MQVARYYLAAGLLGIAAILTLGCDNSADPFTPTGPVTPTLGPLQIRVSTSSPNSGVDADGYSLSIDGGPAQAVGINAMVTFGALSWGRHLITLEGVASNCSVSDTNSRWVDITANGFLLVVSFNVTCIGDPNGAGDWDY